MSNPRSLEPDPSVIGGVSKPPFVRLPDPAALFARRVARLRSLAVGDLAPYLAFLADLTDAQAAIVPSLAEPQLPSPDVLGRARAFAMPPLDRTAFASDKEARGACWDLFETLADVAKPAAAETALAKLRVPDDRTLDGVIGAVLANETSSEDLAAYVLTAAGLQVHFARLASRIDASTLGPVGVGACPVCGGAPAASLVVGWPGAEGARYGACALCGTLWNEVRVKCLVCGSTKGIGLQEVEGQGGTIKAETCDECHSYVKVLYQDKDAAIEPLADDVASLGLDQLMSGGGEYRRAGVNPFLAGY